MKKIIAMIMSVLMMVTLLCGCGGGGASSPEDAAENYIEAVQDADLDAVIDCMPPQISENFADALDVMEEMGDLMGQDMSRDALEEMLKEKTIDEYEIKETEDMDKEDIEDYEKELTTAAASVAAMCDLDGADMEELMKMQEKQKEYEEDNKVEIEEAIWVITDLTVDGETNEEKLPIGKIDGDWYILMGNLG